MGSDRTNSTQPSNQATRYLESPVEAVTSCAPRSAVLGGHLHSRLADAAELRLDNPLRQSPESGPSQGTAVGRVLPATSLARAAAVQRIAGVQNALAVRSLWVAYCRSTRIGERPVAGR